MKKLLFLLLLALGFAAPAQGRGCSEKPDFVIVDEVPPTLTVTADGYPGASSVTIQLVLGDGSVYAEVQTLPGVPVSFSIPDGVRIHLVRALHYVRPAYIPQDELIVT